MTDRAPLADPQRRLHAFLLDQAVALAPGLAAAGLALLAGAGPVATTLVGLGVGLAAAAATGAWAGATGRSPGRAVTGVVLVDAADRRRPVGAARGAVRALLVAGTGWFTAGTGWLALALSVAHGEKGRGWPDRWLRSRVVALPDPAADTRRDGADARARAAVPVVPPQRAPAPRLLPARWVLHLDGTAPVEVRDRLRLGTVDLARMSDGTLVARETGPGPGTLLVRGGAARTVAPGRTTTLLPGDRLRVGERWTRVEGAEHATPDARPSR